ncbi:hypothetical protein [Auritidibacter sp. NML100628]|jgi:hypothetical protein|uniref:hypothetical protein n=1 Tax=Auritidibacter sp. NML100628 TaxID=2170742 RepID=UPI000D72E4B8|nr:hypothetical protein [Auritidibacter sp. NML100628]PXA75180.1 hypothetical protein DCC24_11840 [Auritidibacter sp. NML100628]
MNVRIVPAIGVLGLGVVAAVWVAVFGSPSFDWVLHLGLSFFAAGILTTVAVLQQWQHFAWLPLAGFAVAAIGIITEQASLATTGYFIFAVTTVWHGHQKEKTAQQNHTTDPS